MCLRTEDSHNASFIAAMPAGPSIYLYIEKENISLTVDHIDSTQMFPREKSNSESARLNHMNQPVLNQFHPQKWQLHK